MLNEVELSSGIHKDCSFSVPQKLFRFGKETFSLMKQYFKNVLKFPWE